MNYILLLLGALILFFNFRSVKNIKDILLTHEEKIHKIKTMKRDLMIEAECINIRGAEIIVSLCMGVHAFIYSVFYVLSAFYVRDFVFIALSILLVFSTVKTLCYPLVAFDNPDKLRKEYPAVDILKIVCNFMYVGFVFYQVYLNF